MLLLSGMMFFSGLELAFWSGEFPLLLAKTSVGLVLTFAGVGEVLGQYQYSVHIFHMISIVVACTKSDCTIRALTLGKSDLVRLIHH